MPRLPEIGSIVLYPKRPLRPSDRNGFVFKFYCPIRKQRIRKNCSTRDRREAKRVLRECRERLLNGEYVASGGAITAYQALCMGVVKEVNLATGQDRGMTWAECYDRYRSHRIMRSNVKSVEDAISRITIAERILKTHLSVDELFVKEVFTLSNLELLQERLLAGEESLFERRSPNTVNSMIAALMAFVRYCHNHQWIDRVPSIEKLESREKMKGRPLTGEEFERMLEATPSVVSAKYAAQWRFGLKVLWESGFRLGELMDFSWDEQERIHPVWETDSLPAKIVVPSTQKNKRWQEVPMLPGLKALLQTVKDSNRTGFVISLHLRTKTSGRLSVDCVSRTIAAIGKAAGVVVKKGDEKTGVRTKYASAHDLRRSCASRLMNSGVSAETLKVVMRHSDFATTEKHYGAIRSTQAAANELQLKLSAIQ